MTDDMPTEEGCYWMTCDESGGDEEWVSVYRKNGQLFCDVRYLGNGYLLEALHDGLTYTKWRPVIKISPNVEHTNGNQQQKE